MVPLVLRPLSGRKDFYQHKKRENMSQLSPHAKPFTPRSASPAATGGAGARHHCPEAARPRDAHDQGRPHRAAQRDKHHGRTKHVDTSRSARAEAATMGRNHYHGQTCGHGCAARQTAGAVDRALAPAWWCRLVAHPSTAPYRHAARATTVRHAPTKAGRVISVHFDRNIGHVHMFYDFMTSPPISAAVAAVAAVPSAAAAAAACAAARGDAPASPEATVAAVAVQ